MTSACFPALLAGHLAGLGAAWRPDLGEGGVKPQLPGEQDVDARDHIHVPALQGRLKLACGLLFQSSRRDK